MRTSPLLHSSLLTAFVVILTSAVFAQITQRDVVYLKNGSVIKGAVLEQIPEKTVKIQTTDGSIFIFQMSEVERITKEGVPPPVASAGESVAEPDRRSGFFSLVAGGAMPVGPFAKTEDVDAGMAKFGFIAGMEYANISSGGIYLAIGGAYLMNNVDEEAVLSMMGAYSGMTADITSWKMIVPSISLGFGSTSPGARFFVAGDIGYAFCTSPEITVDYMGMTFTQESEKGNGLVVGGRVGLQTAGGLTFMVRYLASTPKYETSMGDQEQKQALVLFTLGIGF